jgi:hypothetical protein
MTVHFGQLTTPLTYTAIARKKPEQPSILPERTLKAVALSQPSSDNGNETDTLFAPDPTCWMHGKAEAFTDTVAIDVTADQVSKMNADKPLKLTVWFD